jgi:oligopeptide/dipeptide ABC transporter ATP-binding protein
LKRSFIFMPQSANNSDSPLLSVKNLRTEFYTDSGVIPAVDGISFAIFPGQTLALVGESGCGKSVSALSLLRLVPSPPGKITAGSIFLENRDLLQLSEPEMRKIRGGRIAMIFQEPMTSLNPVFTIGEQIMEAIQLHQNVTAREAFTIARNALQNVGVADAGRRLHDYPHQMSGGMKQRVMIAMALACNPSMLIADEPTTALDVTIQAQILELLSDVQARTGMSLLLITHDLGIVAENADVVAMMYAGRIVEFASVYELFRNPLHPYTRGLLGCVPQLGQNLEKLPTIPGSVPSPGNWPAGCRFEPRCTHCQGEARGQCKLLMPPLKEVAPGHWVASFSVPGFDSARETSPALGFRRAREPLSTPSGL